MMLNAITLLLLGNLLERRVGRTATLLQWFIAGGIATAMVMSRCLTEAGRMACR
jgi:membrane associated rhomboid family serine protease